MQIQKVGVLGCGLMGSGIAQVAPLLGSTLPCLKSSRSIWTRGLPGLRSRWLSLPSAGEKGGITPQQKDEIRARLKGTTNKADLADCDIVIEAIIENVEEKKKMYASLDGIVKKDAIFASNTSSISVTELLTAVKRPERFIGLHFFNPVPLMKLVEVVKTIATAPAVYDAAYEFAKKLGKVPVRTSDKTGFIVNRLLVPYLLDAIRAYEEGVGSIEDIDEAMKLGCGYPMGPFTLLDFVGLDTTYYITHVMYDEFKERRFASPPLLKRLVMAGWYGRKSGRDFMITRTRRNRWRGSSEIAEVRKITAYRFRGGDRSQGRGQPIFLLNNRGYGNRPRDTSKDDGAFPGAAHQFGADLPVLPRAPAGTSEFGVRWWDRAY